MNGERSRIAVLLDGSDLSEEALPVAARLAESLDARVVLMRVIDPPRIVFPAYGTDLPPLVDLEERETREELEQLAPRFPGRRVEAVVLVSREPVPSLLTWLHANPVDFVVMATHGRGGLSHLLAGSVTEELLRSGVAPIVAVKPTAVHVGV